MCYPHSSFPGVVIYEPRVFEDSRGYFFESYHRRKYEQAGIGVEFVQDNESRSRKGVLRGLHYQVAPFAQGKLIRVLEGEILDVALDLRRGSPAFLKHFKVRLSSGNKRQLFIPQGFAHGFVVLSEWAEVFYKCDNYYSKEHERGIHYRDETAAIDWEVPQDQIILSGKDDQLPRIEQAEHDFVFAVEA